MDIYLKIGLGVLLFVSALLLGMWGGHSKKRWIITMLIMMTIYFGWKLVKLLAGW